MPSFSDHAAGLVPRRPLGQAVLLLRSEPDAQLVDLCDARLEAPAICRVLTVLHDTMTARLLELAFARHGAPPVDFAWLVYALRALTGANLQEALRAVAAAQTR